MRGWIILNGLSWNILSIHLAFLSVTTDILFDRLFAFLHTDTGHLNRNSLEHVPAVSSPQ